MKIKLSYETDAELLEALHRPLQYYIDHGAKLKKSDRNSPYRHAYIDVKKKENPCNATLCD